MEKKSKKSVPLRGKQSKLVKNVHFPRKGTLFLLFFYYFSDFKNFDCFPRKGTFFLLFFSIYQISKE